MTFRGRDYAMVDGMPPTENCASSCILNSGFFAVPNGWQVALDNSYSRAAVAMGGDKANVFGYVCKWLAAPENVAEGRAYSNFPEETKMCKEGVSAVAIKSKV